MPFVIISHHLISLATYRQFSILGFNHRYLWFEHTNLNTIEFNLNSITDEFFSNLFRLWPLNVLVAGLFSWIGVNPGGFPLGGGGGFPRILFCRFCSFFTVILLSTCSYIFSFSVKHNARYKFIILYYVMLHITCIINVLLWFLQFVWFCRNYS